MEGTFFSKCQFTLIQDDIRIKELPFQDWLNRTVDTVEVKQQVIHFIQTADKKLQKYIRLQKKKKMTFIPLPLMSGLVCGENSNEKGYAASPASYPFFIL